MTRIIAVEVEPGSIVQSADVRAEEITPNFGYMFSSAVASCLPFGQVGADVDTNVLACYRPDTDVDITVIRPGAYASDSASAVVNRLVSKLSISRRSSIDCVIYCHSSIDEDNSSVPVTRLCAELGLADPLSFSISQLHNCCVFAGLRMAQSVLTSALRRRNVLLVAADKWAYPFFRSFGPLGSFGDGAGAIMIVADSVESGMDIMHLEFLQADSKLDVFGIEVGWDSKRFRTRVAQTLIKALDAVPVHSKEVTCIVHPSRVLSMSRAILEEAGLAEVPIQLGLTAPHGHLSSADPLAGLMSAWIDSGIPDGAVSLLWNFGVNGEIACMVFQRVQVPVQ